MPRNATHCQIERLCIAHKCSVINTFDTEVLNYESPISLKALS
ncbi:hypothetical protein D515_03380 [Grimontia indica]|uniref:Uncharacterized protein n=1 Tax=Grimontia indica TaxID=1056512 RepID=R1GNZ5_9GAMM|nr:hypothetical protein D515_03380 [Grimontia indica]